MERVSVTYRFVGACADAHTYAACARAYAACADAYAACADAYAACAACAREARVQRRWEELKAMAVQMQQKESLAQKAR